MEKAAPGLGAAFSLGGRETVRESVEPYWLDDEDDEASAAVPASAVVPVVALVPAAVPAVPAVVPAVVSVVAPALAPGAGTVAPAPAVVSVVAAAPVVPAAPEASVEADAEASAVCFLWCLVVDWASDMAGMAIMAVTMAAAEAIWMKDFMTTKPFSCTGAGSGGHHL